MNRSGSKTFAEYGERFQIEEGFLDEKSGLFGLEDSKLRDALSLERLTLVLAVATLLLVSEGLQTVQRGDRTTRRSPLAASTELSQDWSAFHSVRTEPRSSGSFPLDPPGWT